MPPLSVKRGEAARGAEAEPTRSRTRRRLTPPPLFARKGGVAPRDLYQVLGVERGADRETIQKAYRKLARETHPDLNPGDAKAAERFSEVSQAWEVLGDAERRALYDEFGQVSLESGFDAERAREAREAFGRRFGGAAPGGGFEGHEFQFGDLDDLFGRFFGGEARTGGAGRGMPPLRGSDLEAELELDFEEAVRGGEKRLTLGGPAGSRQVTVRIPPGVDSGGRLRLPGHGAPGAGGGPAGDLHVRLRVRPHRVFRRRDRDLEFDLPISILEAIRGAEIEVPTLDGRVTLRVPAGTHSGTRLRLRGKGVPRSSGSPGDLYARVEIRVPRGLDDADLASLEALERFEDAELRKGLFE